MTFKQFQKEMIARKDWSTIRVIAWGKDQRFEGDKYIAEIGEFKTGHRVGYYDLFIAKGKRLAAFCRRWFFEKGLDQDGVEITFEEVKDEKS